MDEYGLKLNFGQTTYDEWRSKGTGLLIEELLLAVGNSDTSTGRLTFSLPHRDALLPDLSVFAALKERVCIGGVQCVLLYRTNEGILKMPLSVRSAKTGDNAGLVQTLPRGFHQPLESNMRFANWSACKQLSQTLARELFEELLGGERLVGQPSQSFISDVLLPKLVKFITTHTRAWLTALSFAMEDGNYQLTVVIEIPNHAEFTDAAVQLRRQIAAGQPHNTNFVTDLGKGWLDDKNWITNWEAQDENVSTVPFVEENILAYLGDYNPEKPHWIHGSILALAEAAFFAREMDWLPAGLPIKRG
uniref:Uncharacterized protein n=1 Tax=Candidatus Kentrum sp. TC TaxID=2126339 RepID=A0A450ZR01_9GAMM|nr:MAG: hypothetical protein BECKTC1821F_GA0114240_100951 [Candidatus Kentron sp. TC]